MSRRVRVKPSKAQSAVGFVVGIVFCFIGIIIAIPTFGPFGVFWTLIAVVITITNGYNAFTDKGIASSEIIIEDDTEIDRNRNHYSNSSYNTNQQRNFNSEKSVEERLSELQNLYNKGMINIEEYQKTRQQILEDL